MNGDQFDWAMSMISYEVYKTLHLAGAFALMASYGGLAIWAMNGKEGSENQYEKLATISHGIGLAVIVIAGFGMLANLGISPAGTNWVYIKILLWVFLGGGLALLRRKPEHASKILAGAFSIAIFAGMVGTNHVAWFGS